MKKNSKWFEKANIYSTGDPDFSEEDMRKVIDPLGMDNLAQAGDLAPEEITTNIGGEEVTAFIQTHLNRSRRPVLLIQMMRTGTEGFTMGRFEWEQTSPPEIQMEAFKGAMLARPPERGRAKLPTPEETFKNTPQDAEVSREDGVTTVVMVRNGWTLTASQEQDELPGAEIHNGEGIHLTIPHEMLPDLLRGQGFPPAETNPDPAETASNTRPSRRRNEPREAKGAR